MTDAWNGMEWGGGSWIGQNMEGGSFQFLLTLHWLGRRDNEVQGYRGYVAIEGGGGVWVLL